MSAVRYADWWNDGNAARWWVDPTTPPDQPWTPERIVLWHLEGVAWHDRPRPRRWHRCRPVTRGLVGLCEGLERCACGAIRRGGPFLLFAPHWLERNTR